MYNYPEIDLWLVEGRQSLSPKKQTQKPSRHETSNYFPHQLINSSFVTWIRYALKADTLLYQYILLKNNSSYLSKLVVPYRGASN